MLLQISNSRDLPGNEYVTKTESTELCPSTLHPGRGGDSIWLRKGCGGSCHRSWRWKDKGRMMKAKLCPQGSFVGKEILETLLLCPYPANQTTAAVLSPCCYFRKWFPEKEILSSPRTRQDRQFKCSFAWPPNEMFRRYTIHCPDREHSPERKMPPCMVGRIFCP